VAQAGILEVGAVAVVVILVVVDFQAVEDQVIRGSKM
jgi:hypothetical protein